MAKTDVNTLRMRAHKVQHIKPFYFSDTPKNEGNERVRGWKIKPDILPNCSVTRSSPITPTKASRQIRVSNLLKVVQKYYTMQPMGHTRGSETINNRSPDLEQSQKFRTWFLG